MLKFVRYYCHSVKVESTVFSFNVILMEKSQQNEMSIFFVIQMCMLPNCLIPANLG